MTPIRRTLPLLSAAVVTAVLAGCGSSSHKTSTASSAPPATANSPATPAVAGAKVTIKSFAFAPANVHVTVGGKVTFTNQDNTPHTATADDGASFDSGTLNQGQSKTITFSKAGTFSYHCAFHAFMTAKVVVS